MNKILLSFIIPIYNVEKYLNMCVDSISSQIDRLKVEDEVEIILVDDGSRDLSGKICDEFACEKKYIRVIHKTNGGLASARNAGLDIAIGKYIAFVDSDDKINTQCLDDIILWIKSSDAEICFMKAIKFFPNGKKEDFGEKIERKEIYGKSREDVVRYLSTRPKFPGSACCKLYLQQFLINNNISFPNDNRISEDLGFAYDCITYAQKFDVIECLYYEYRQQREGSITNSFSSKSFWDLSLFITESIEKSTTNRKPNESIHRYALSFVAYEYIQLLLGFIKLEKKERKKAKLYFDEYKWVLDYAASKKIVLIKRIISLLGYSLTSFLLDLYVYKIR